MILQSALRSTALLTLRKKRNKRRKCPRVHRMSNEALIPDGEVGVLLEERRVGRDGALKADCGGLGRS
jgi:hypothetical protein